MNSGNSAAVRATVSTTARCSDKTEELAQTASAAHADSPREESMTPSGRTAERPRRTRPESNVVGVQHLRRSRG